MRLDYDEATSRLRMIAVKRVAAGEEVFNTYGALGDDELLRRYGFVMRCNPHGGGAEVTLREVVEAARRARSHVGAVDAESNPDRDSDSDSDDDAPPVMPPMSDSEDEEDEEDDEHDDASSDGESSDGDSPSAGPREVRFSSGFACCADGASRREARTDSPCREPVDPPRASRRRSRAFHGPRTVSRGARRRRVRARGWRRSGRGRTRTRTTRTTGTTGTTTGSADSNPSRWNKCGTARTSWVRGVPSSHFPLVARPSDHDTFVGSPRG